jgi:hypothetical protein
MVVVHSGIAAELLQQSFGFVGFFVFASFFEWGLHRYFMHGGRLLQYPFHAHALVHHGIFRADNSYHLRNDNDKPKVTFAWWNAPLLLVLNLPVVLTVQYFLGWSLLWGGLAAISCYYVLYEYLHWCMHVPSNRKLEKSRVFVWLNAHHRLHHQYHLKNLNVVFPLADLLLRSRVSQPTPKRLAA